jgi:hypothetical protein
MERLSSLANLPPTGCKNDVNPFFTSPALPKGDKIVAGGPVGGGLLGGVGGTVIAWSPDRRFPTWDGQSAGKVATVTGLTGVTLVAFGG